MTSIGRDRSRCPFPHVKSIAKSIQQTSCYMGLLRLYELNELSSAFDHPCVKGRPSGSVAQLEECSHCKGEALGLSPSWAMIFSSPVTFGGSVWVYG